jgi:hypothetical protein
MEAELPGYEGKHHQRFFTLDNTSVPSRQARAKSPIAGFLRNEPRPKEWRSMGNPKRKADEIGTEGAPPSIGIVQSGAAIDPNAASQSEAAPRRRLPTRLLGSQTLRIQE